MQSSNFSTFLLTLVFLKKIYSSYPNGCEVVSPSFDLHFSVISDVELCVLIGHLFIFFGEISVQGLCPFLRWVICVFCCCVRSSLCILDVNLIWFASIFSLCIDFFFYCWTSFLNTIYLFLKILLPMLLVQYPRNNCQIQSCEDFALFFFF